MRRDADFLAETGTLPRHMADRFARPAASRSAYDGTITAALASEALPPHSGDAITIYSEKLAHGKYPGDGVYGTARYGPAAFGRHANFSKQVGDYTKDTSNE